MKMEGESGGSEAEGSIEQTRLFIPRFFSYLSCPSGFAGTVWKFIVGVAMGDLRILSIPVKFLSYIP